MKEYFCEDVVRQFAATTTRTHVRIEMLRQRLDVLNKAVDYVWCEAENGREVNQDKWHQIIREIEDIHETLAYLKPEEENPFKPGEMEAGPEIEIDPAEDYYSMIEELRRGDG